MKRLFTLLTLTMSVGACSSATSNFNDMASNMRFIGRNDIVKNGYTGNVDDVRYTSDGITDSIKNVAALSVSHFDSSTGTTAPTVINFKKNNGVFYAETKLSDSDNKYKSFFNETDLDFGVDKGNQGVNIGLSMKF